MAFVYWIHLPEHTDMLSQGYIGVTSKSVNDRFSAHKYDAAKGSSLAVHRAIRKYGTALVLETVVDAGEDYCYELEGKLRQTPRTGWNTVTGGRKSPMSGIPTKDHPCYGKPCSESTRAKISKANSGPNNGMSGRVGELNHFYGKKHSEETLSKLSSKKISDHHKQINREKMLSYRDWERPTSVTSTWANALEFHMEYSTGMSAYKTAKKYNVTPSRLTKIFQRFAEGWVPTADDYFMSWLNKQKEECNGT